MNLLATGHMLADVVAIMGKFYLSPALYLLYFPSRVRLYLGQSRLLLVENHFRILLFAIPRYPINQAKLPSSPRQGIRKRLFQSENASKVFRLHLAVGT